MLYLIVVGNWGQWGRWSTCSLSCDGGIQERTRVCNDPPSENGGTTCHGDDIQFITCNSQHCPVDGNWSLWSIWSSCSATCGVGVQERKRQCINPVAQFGGKDCNGLATDTRNCNMQDCPGYYH